MLIGVDRNQLTGTHKKSNEANHRRMMSMGHELMPLPLPYGDYVQITDEIAETVKRRGDKIKKMDLVNDILRLSKGVETKSRKWIWLMTSRLPLTARTQLMRYVETSAQVSESMTVLEKRL